MSLTIVLIDTEPSYLRDGGNRGLLALPLGIAGAGIIAATYVVPWLRSVWIRHLEKAADAALQLALAKEGSPLLGIRRRPPV